MLGFAFRSTPLFHCHFIMHPVLFILCLISVKRATLLIIPVKLIAIHLLNHLLFMCEPCTVCYELFIPVVVGESDDPCYVIYFMLV
jgi:hypothetical protein